MILWILPDGRRRLSSGWVGRDGCRRQDSKTGTLVLQQMEFIKEEVGLKQLSVLKWFKQMILLYNKHVCVSG